MSGSARLIGPFAQIVTLAGVPLRGPVRDDALEILTDAAFVVIDDKIASIGPWQDLKADFVATQIDDLSELGSLVAMPGLIDAHTHLCFAGDRARDYALRVAGASYLEIAEAGGGILDTVRKTRLASESELIEATIRRARAHLKSGVTTCEVKSGYGLSVEDELKMLRVIASVAGTKGVPELIPTCLAAHVLPPEFPDAAAYLELIARELLPKVKSENLAKRVDAFVDHGAFDTASAEVFLQAAQALGFAITVHADQFSTGGSALAVKFDALSADHLEVAGEKEIEAISRSGTTAIALPGASLGLGLPFAPARKILDAGGALAIASDWNPGSAPMGRLVMQAAVLGAAQKLTLAETLSGVTVRAARALALVDRGVLAVGLLADIVAFPARDWREILYWQGALIPSVVCHRGEVVRV